MKTLRIIVLIACAVITIFFVSYGVIQTRYAEEAKVQAIQYRDQAVALQREAETQRESAIQTAAEARRAQNEAEQLTMKLEACKK